MLSRTHTTHTLMMDVKKMTVSQLRSELESRALDSSGLKPILQKRLETALASEDENEDINKNDSTIKEEEEELMITIRNTEDSAAADVEHKEDDDAEENNNGLKSEAAAADDDENDDYERNHEDNDDDTNNDDNDNDNEGENNNNTVVKSNRLMNARKILRRNPYDASACDVFFVEARGRPSVAKDIYEEILKYHPRCANAWIAYVNCAIEKKDDEAISEIFSRCLRDVLAPELWLSYVNYAKGERNEYGTSEEGARAIKAAFEYCVDHVGEDVESGKIWEEYIEFLKGVNAGFIAPEGAQSEQHETARMMELRRVYMRAISVPTQSLESLAKDYEAFENSYDKKFARTLLAESAPKLFACKSAYKEREKLNEQLFEGLGYDVKVYKNGIAIGDPVHTSKAADCHLDAFRRFIAWEKTNPQKLEGVGVVSALKKTENKPEEDPPRVRERIALAYEKCLLTCENYPEVWLEYSNWHENAGRSGDAAEILMRARTMLPGSIMLVLAAADLEESQQNIEGMKAVYESYMTAYEEKRESEKLAEGEGSAIVKMMDDDTSVVYSEYIRACRRSDSQASSRKAFLRARKAPGCSWLVYATAALLEWRYDEADKPCRNVFELGLKSYMHVPSYVLTYTNHLISLGDVGNSRVVFERALSVERPDISIFDAFVKFEHEYGSYESFRDAENRRSEFLEPSLSVLGSSRLTVAKLVQNVFERHNFLPDVAPLQSESLPHYAKLGVSSIQKFMALSIASGRKELSRAKLPPPPKAPKGAPPPPPKKTSVALASASAGDDGARAEQPESTNSVAGTTAQRAAPPSIGLSALPVVVAPPLPETLRELFNKLPGPVAFAKMPAPRVDAVLDALKQSDLTIEGKAELLAKMQGKDSRPQSNGSKRTASQMLATDAMGSEPSVSFKQPTKDVFKERQSKMQKASAEFQ